MQALDMGSRCCRCHPSTVGKVSIVLLDIVVLSILIWALLVHMACPAPTALILLLLFVLRPHFAPVIWTMD